MLPLSSAPDSVCILRLSAIGDVTHVLPTLRTLQHHWPKTSISWIIGQTEAELLQGLDGVELLIVDKSQGIKGLYKLRQRLKARSFDVLLHMQPSLRASLYSLAIQAGVRLGFDSHRARNLQWLFTNSQIPHVSKQHVLDSFLDFAHTLGLENSILRWDLPIPRQAREFAQQHMPEGKNYLVINPCSSTRIRNFRNWSPNSYAQVLDYACTDFGLRPVLTGGPCAQEKEYARAICSQSKHPVQNLVGKTRLKQLAAVLARARVVIAPDTGPLHIANALGTPVIGLYATSNPERTGPYMYQHLVVNRYPDAVRSELGCKVQELTWGQRVRNKEAMDLISIQDVMQKLKTALQKQQVAKTKN